MECVITWAKKIARSRTIYLSEKNANYVLGVIRKKKGERLIAMFSDKFCNCRAGRRKRFVMHSRNDNVT